MLLFIKSQEKYGYDGFNKVVLVQCSTDELNEQEIFWIKEKESIKYGYNLKEGGSHGAHSIETREKLRLANIGKQHIEETKSKIRLARKNSSMESWAEMFCGN